MDFGRIIMHYMEYCHSRHLRQRTMASYEQTLVLFSLWMEKLHGIRQVEAVRETHIRQYIIDLQSRGKYTFCSTDGERNCPQNRRDYQKRVSNITINNYLRNLHVFFAWLEEMEYIPKSPMKRIKAQPEERKPREYLEDEEVKRLLQGLDRSYFSEYRDLLVIMLMLDSGTRLGETLSMELKQVDLHDRSVLLPADKTKGRKARTVYFSEKTAKELRRWIQFKDRYCESDLLFPVKHHGGQMGEPVFERNFKQYLLMKDLHLLDSRLAMIIPSGVSVYNAIIARTYMRTSIDPDLYGAAEIDGASDLTIFLRIVLPLSKPIIAVFTMMYAVGHWNSFFGGLMYLRDRNLFPLQLVLRQVLVLNQVDLSEINSMNFDKLLDKQFMSELIKYSSIVVASLPMMLLYPFIQKHFVKGIMLGSLKG